MFLGRQIAGGSPVSWNQYSPPIEPKIFILAIFSRNNYNILYQSVIVRYHEFRSMYMQDNHELTFLLNDVIQIVSKIALIIKQSPFSVSEKTDATDILTSNDLASQHMLIKELGALLPDSGFYCEEENVHECSKEWVWIIDPIDGTANYSRGIANCAISVALMRKQKVVLGVVCDIYSGDVYSATLGGGAFLNSRPISVSANSFDRSILCTAMSLYKKEHAKVCSDIIYDAYMQCNDVRRFGSCALELCYLASGKCDLYFEIRVFPWDYAAGYLILQEAGGVISGLAHEALKLNVPSVVVAANNAENHAKLSRIVDKHLPSTPYKE